MASSSGDWPFGEKSLKDRFFVLFNNELFSDVHFVVGEDAGQKRIPAHKLVLSAGSPVFFAMFNGPLAHHSDDSIQIPDVEEDAMLALLMFLYSDEVKITEKTVMNTLYAADKYLVSRLQKACRNFVKMNLRRENALMFLKQARLFYEDELATLCLDTIDIDIWWIVSTDEFMDIDLDMLCEILRRDILGAPEIHLFDAVVRWSERECKRKELPMNAENKRMVLGRAISLIRFPLMTIEEFSKGPSNSGILLDQETISVFQYLSTGQTTNLVFSTIDRNQY